MKQNDYTVSIRKINGNLDKALKMAFADLGGLEKHISKGDRVILKPNINGSECVTSLSAVEGVINILLENSISDIAIAESTFGDAKNTAFFFRQNGYTGLAEKYGIELINLNESETVEIDVKNPLVKKTLKIAKEVYEADKIINLPVMKVHYATGITLCLKNLKGILVGPEKRTFHDLGLNEGIADLNRMIRPALNIVDCTTCMERMGPKGGDLLELDAIIMGTDPGITDFIGMKMMGYELKDVKHLEMYLEENRIDYHDIEVSGTDIDQVKKVFKKVDLSAVWKQNPDIQNTDACSACENALMISMMCADNPDLSGKKIYLGSRTADRDFSKKAIAFGRCCIEQMKDADYKIHGCPPYPFELGKQLQGNGNR